MNKHTQFNSNRVIWLSVCTVITLAPASSRSLKSGVYVKIKLDISTAAISLNQSSSELNLLTLSLTLVAISVDEDDAVQMCAFIRGTCRCREAGQTGRHRTRQFAQRTPSECESGRPDPKFTASAAINDPTISRCIVRGKRIDASKLYSPTILM